jgi:hypothetical protein
MTNQAVIAKVGNSGMVRSFDCTSTDGTTFTGVSQLLIDVDSNQNLGILIPGQSIDSVQVQYTAGVCQWRIINSNTLMVARSGWGQQLNYVCPMESKIVPYVVQPTDLLQVFTEAVNSTAGDTEIQAWLTTTSGKESFSVTVLENDTATAMTNSITGQGLGDWAFGSTLVKVEVAAEGGAFINQVDVVDQVGGVIWSSYGNTKLPTAGGKSTMTNLVVPANLKVAKGWSIRVYATTA